MATTGLYAETVGAAWKANVDLINDRIVAALIDKSAYSVDLDADEFLSDVPTAAVVATVDLTGKSVGAGGEFGADDSTFAKVESGASVGAVILYKNTGLAASSRLLYYDDQATGLPLTGDGDDVVVRWPDPIFSS